MFYWYQERGISIILQSHSKSVFVAVQTQLKLTVEGWRETWTAQYVVPTTTQVGEVGY